jgi:hypothetical protein
MISAELLLLNGRERQREMMAQADRQRLARQLRDLSSRTRRARGGLRRGRRPAGLTWPEVAGRESV